MAKDILHQARKEMARRHFGQAIKILESGAEIYQENADYYILLGTACLYAGDVGTSYAYYQKARKINLTNVTLLLGQAAIFLRRGDTEKAINYYIEVLENEPGNKTARDAMEFIRVHGDYTTICRWVDTGRIEQFFPKIGVNPDKILYGTVLAVFCIAGSLFALSFAGRKTKNITGPRMDLSSIQLTQEEKTNSQNKDLSSVTCHYILSEKEITSSYEKALKYFQENDDNHAQIEINRILNSNASLPIRQKANILMGYLSVPGFDNLIYSPDFKVVEKDPDLYLDCYVIWSGRVSDVIESESSYEARFLIGYDTMKNLDGIITVKFSSKIFIESDKPVKILGKLIKEDGNLILSGRSVYQSVNF
ncbi:MAG: hypothetical protein MJ182_00485 [Treponema sp.]|nr:hypothetical protein [Treponema sp.]